MSGTSSWLQKQRKSELVELADSVGFKDYDGLKKQELEVALDEYLTKNSTQFSGDTRLTPFYKRRADTSPVKKEPTSTATDLVETKIKPARRRVTKAAEEIVSAIENAADDEDAERARTALTRTPRAALAFASSVPLPPSPGDVADAIDRRTQVVRSRLNRAYQESGIAETTESTREVLSSVIAVQGLIMLSSSTISAPRSWLTDTRSPFLRSRL